MEDYRKNKNLGGQQGPQNPGQGQGGQGQNQRPGSQNQRPGSDNRGRTDKTNNPQSRDNQS